MSGKVQKQLRKLARQELEKRMNPNQPPQGQQRQINIIAEIEAVIVGLELLTGEKPASITLQETMYNMYIQTVQNNAEALGLNPGFKGDIPTFRGVKIEKKSPLIVPPTPPIATGEPKTN